MSSVGLLDSKAVFRARLRSIDIPDSVADALEQGGVDTLAKLAFLTSCQPGVGDDGAFVKAVSALLNYDDTNVIPAGLLSGMRRIWFEAHTCAISEVRSKIEKPEDQPKRLPAAEREVRRRAQQDRLTGILIEGQLEPSNMLVDAVYTIRDEEVVRWIDPSTCTSRVQELKGVKKEQFLKVDSSTGTVKQVSREQVGTTDVSTAYHLRLAYQRRNLAFDQLDLLPYAVGERYINKLFELMSQPVPSSHVPIGIEQVVLGDKQIWLKISETCRTGVAKTMSGYPIEAALEKALLDPIVMATLQPLVRARGSTSNESWNKGGKGSGGDSNRSNPYGPGKGDGKNRKGQSKGKWSNSKGQSRFAATGGPVPSVLKGGAAKTSDGAPICFNYNLRGCQGAKAGAKCNRGLHVCAKCFSSDHTFSQCTKSS